MPEKTYITKRVRNLTVGVLVLVYISLCAWSIATTRSWINRPFAGFLLMKNNIVPILWLSEWEGFKQGIKFGDLVVAVNDQPVSSSDEINEFVLDKKPGTRLTYTVRRGIRLKQRLQFSIPVSIFTINVIFLTARGSSVSENVGTRSGGDEFMAKPFDPKELREKVMKALGASS